MMEVYRYGDLVAFNPPNGKGETVYLSPSHARDLMWAINEALGDIDTMSFTQSDLEPCVIPTPGTRDQKVP